MTMLYTQGDIDVINNHGWTMDTNDCLDYAEQLFARIKSCTYMIDTCESPSLKELYTQRRQAYAMALSLFAGEHSKYYIDLSLRG